MNDAPIGVFDSGVGGIGTLKSCLDLLDGESFVYLADRSGLPYGTKRGEEIEKRVDECVRALLSEGVKAIVVACNTATNVGIAALREKYNMPFVGVEPAVKPAALECKRGNVLVLLTPATAAQAKFLSLLERFDNGRIIVAPQSGLAETIETHIDDIDAIRCEVYDILRRYRDVEGVVLGCTHYVFLKDIIRDFYGGRIKIYDGNDGVAKRLKAVLEQNDMLAGAGKHFIKFKVI